MIVAITDPNMETATMTSTVDRQEVIIMLAFRDIGPLPYLRPGILNTYIYTRHGNPPA